MISALSAVLTPYTSMQLVVDGVVIVYVSVLPETVVRVNDGPQVAWVSWSPAVLAPPGTVTQRPPAVFAMVLVAVAARAAVGGPIRTRAVARTADRMARGFSMCCLQRGTPVVGENLFSTI